MVYYINQVLCIEFLYEGNQIGTLDLCSLYENCIQVMIMSEKLYQNPIPEWNAAWFIRGENPMYTQKVI